MSLLSFLLYVFVTTFTPGPNNIMAMLIANQYGLKRTVKFCFGVGAGFFVIMILCSYFNLLLKSFIPKIELIMTIIGSFYMLYLAYKIIKSKPNDKESNEDKNTTFFAGMALQFVNVKVILYGITAISTFVIPFYSSNFSLIMIFIISSFCWFCEYCVLGRFWFNFSKILINL